jgi:hypothetical protein
MTGKIFAPGSHLQEITKKYYDILTGGKYEKLCSGLCEKQF